MKKKKIVLLVPNLNGGGAERVILTLFNYITNNTRDCEVYLMTVNYSGHLAHLLPQNSQVINLDKKRVRGSVIKLISEINKIKPDSILSTLTNMNMLLILVKPFLKGNPKVIVRETNPPSAKFKGKLTKVLYRILYRFADEIIGISQGVSRDVSSFALIPHRRITTIYNPININEITNQSFVKTNHNWLDNKEKPVLIAIGRLVKQKDFQTLIKAFKKVREGLDCRLIILGEGPEEADLRKLISELELEEHVSLQGFVKNPYSYLKRADLFVLSSQWEGFGLVIAEALATNTPIVSTNCTGAPAEILMNGRYGLLVEPKDYSNMASAILTQIKTPIKSNLENRAGDFDSSKIIKQYLKLLC